MYVYCIVLFKFNYSIGDIKNSDLGEEIVCLREGKGGKGEGSGGKGDGSGGKRGREVGVRGREVGNAYPPVHPLDKLLKGLSQPRKSMIWLTDHLDMFLTELTGL